MPAAMHRALVLHGYPPVPCLYTFEKGLKTLGYDVVSVGPSAEYVKASHFQSVEPDCHYLSVEPDARLNDIFDRIGGAPDWVFYLRPAKPFLPRGLAECPVPTVGWLEDDFKFANIDHSLVPWFDLAPTAYAEISELFLERGYDNRPCFNYFTASWLLPDVEIDFSNRPIDIAFIGHLHPRQMRARCLELEKLMRLRAEGVNVLLGDGVYLNDMLRIYARAKFVFQHSGQGFPNLTYRVGEAMTAGAVVVSKRPNRVEGLPSPLVEGKHLLYYDTMDDLRALLRHYLAHEDERRAIAEAGFRYVREEYPWTEQIRLFLDRHVKTIPSDFLERRRERLARFGVDADRERLDAARGFLIMGQAVEPAERVFEEISGWQENPHHLAFHAMMKAMRNDLEAYERAVDALFRLRPDHFAGLYNHALIYFGLRKQIGNRVARETLETAIDRLSRVDAGTLDPREIDRTFLTSFDTRLSFEFGGAYVDHAPGPPVQRRIQALCLFQLQKCAGLLCVEIGDESAAERHFAEALRFISDDGDSLLHLGRFAARRGDADAAERLLKQALESEPLFMEAAIELAALLLRSGRTDEAARLLEEELLSHYFADELRLKAFLLLGNAYAVLGEKTKAMDALHEGLKELRTGSANLGFARPTRDPKLLTPDQIAQFERLFLDTIRNVNRAVPGSAPRRRLSSSETSRRSSDA